MRIIKFFLAAAVAAGILTGNIAYAVVNNRIVIDAGGDFSVVTVPSGSVYEVRFGTLIKVIDEAAAVSVSGTHRAVITADGSLWTWGSNEYGQLGNGTTEPAKAPVKVLNNVAAVSLSEKHTAAIKTDGSLWMWGSNEYGQIGCGNAEYSLNPVKIMDEAASVSLGENHTLILKKDNSIWACGYGYSAYPVKIKIPTDVLSMPSLWVKPYIDKAAEYGLLPEEYRNNYRLNITREEFCTLIYFLIEKKRQNSDLYSLYQTDKAAFSDTSSEYVNEIVRLGIVNGTGDNKFDPLGEITREQAAKILCETAKVLGYDVSAPVSGFYDISDWAGEGVNFVCDRGIMLGDNFGFDPRGVFTKEQAIVTIVRFYENLP